MRISSVQVVFMLVFAGMSVAADIEAQVLEKRVSLNVEAQEIGKALRQIEKQSAIRFVFSPQVIKSRQKVNIRSEKQKLGELLDEILVPLGISYEVSGKYILLSDERKAFEEAETEEENLSPVTATPDRTVRGTVTDQKGEPLPGVTIMVKGNTQGTSTNVEGGYSLSDIPDAAVLVFSFVGMQAHEVVVGSQTVINVVLEEDMIGLEEVVAIGYGTARKQDLTGAVVNVKAEDFIKYNPASVTELLRSAVPGVKVGYSTRASATPDFQIRGQNSIKASASAEAAANQPLIVVDGVIFNGSLTEINVNDIESVDILKDASAASIYGSRASNGVVVFTTKKGKSSRPTIRFSSKYGIVTAANRMQTYSGNELTGWLVDVYEAINSKLMDEWSIWTPYDRVPAQYRADWLNANNIPGETDAAKITNVWLDNLGFEQSEKDYYFAGKSYDWEKWLFQTGQRQDYSLNVSGRGERVTYYWSMGYRNNESVVVGDGFSSITSRLNLDVSVTDFLNLGLNANFSYQDDGQHPLDYDLYRSMSPFDTPWQAGMPQTRENLKLYSVGNNIVNPLLDYSYITRKFDGYKLFPTMYARLNLPFGIVFTSNFTQRLDFTRRFRFNDVANPRWTSGGEEEGVSREHDQTYGWQSDNFLNWGHAFGKHRLDVTALANAERNRGWNTYAFSNNFSPNAVLGYHNLSYGLQPRNSADDWALSRTALMGRINYSFDNRYYLSASLRRDGFSGFGSNMRHAVFPSVSAGWTISQENFAASAAGWLSYLKLRASWGVNGNSSGIGTYESYARLGAEKYLNYQNGYYAVPILYISQLGNDNLAWEKNQAHNIGLDYGLWNGRVKGSIDFYHSKTDDLLLNKTLPTVTGFSAITTNVGKLQNKGFDLSVNTINAETRDFRWTSSLNVSYNRNKIVSLNGVKSQVVDENGPVFDSNGNPVMKEADDLLNEWFIGQDKDVIWDYKVEGVYQVAESDAAARFNLYPGDFKIADTKADGVLNADDKVFQGTTNAPWYLTLRNEFSYKGFDLGLVVLGKLGYKGGTEYPFNNNANIYRTHNWYKLPYWTPENPINDYARINSIQLAQMQIWVPKSYVRFQNVSLGYNVPEHFVKPLKLASARVGFNLENVAVFSKWKIGDPESETEMPRVYSFSVDFSF